MMRDCPKCGRPLAKVYIEELNAQIYLLDESEGQLMAEPDRLRCVESYGVPKCDQCGADVAETLGHVEGLTY